MMEINPPLLAEIGLFGGLGALCAGLLYKAVSALVDGHRRRGILWLLAVLGDLWLSYCLLGTWGYGPRYGSKEHEEDGAPKTLLVHAASYAALFPLATGRVAPRFEAWTGLFGDSANSSASNRFLLGFSFFSTGSIGRSSEGVTWTS